ncbi:hypothetical protein BGX27_000785 [Mortierella sp. AM989]|nr:hypothetical protein BGX27_000785 [Mortierella sp. AM989]
MQLNILDDVATESGLAIDSNGRYTTHCFRRGGAQHCFMFIAEKWSLKAVRWWEGWSGSEGSGAIMRYLLEEFMRCETGFGDMLVPNRNDSQHALFIGGPRPPETEVVTGQALAIALEAMKKLNCESRYLPLVLPFWKS